MTGSCSAAAGPQAVAAQKITSADCLKMKDQYQKQPSDAIAAKFEKLGCSFKIGPIFSTLVT